MGSWRDRRQYSRPGRNRPGPGRDENDQRASAHRPAPSRWVIHLRSRARSLDVHGCCSPERRTMPAASRLRATRFLLAAIIDRDPHDEDQHPRRVAIRYEIRIKERVGTKRHIAIHAAVSCWLASSASCAPARPQDLVCASPPDAAVMNSSGKRHRHHQQRNQKRRGPSDDPPIRITEGPAVMAALFHQVHREFG